MPDKTSNTDDKKAPLKKTVAPLTENELDSAAGGFPKGGRGYTDISSNTSDPKED